MTSSRSASFRSHSLERAVVWTFDISFDRSAVCGAGTPLALGSREPPSLSCRCCNQNLQPRYLPSGGTSQAAIESAHFSPLGRMIARRCSFGSSGGDEDRAVFRQSNHRSTAALMMLYRLPSLASFAFRRKGSPQTYLCHEEGLTRWLA